MDDRDVYRSAKRLLDLYGSDAMAEAGKRADILLMGGDMEGAATWKRIVRAIAEIQSTDGGMKH